MKGFCLVVFVTRAGLVSASRPAAAPVAISKPAGVGVRQPDAPANPIANMA